MQQISNAYLIHLALYSFSNLMLDNGNRQNTINTIGTDNNTIGTRV